MACHVLRRRTSSHGESDRRNSLLSEDDREEGYRRRVVSFTCPGSSSTSNDGGRSSSGSSSPRSTYYQEHLHQHHYLSGTPPKDASLQRIQAEEDVPDGVGKGGFRRRLKSLSIGMSSPSGSSHDMAVTPEGGIVNSMVRRSLMQAAWPLSVSLEDIEGHQKDAQRRYVGGIALSLPLSLFLSFPSSFFLHSFSPSPSPPLSCSLPSSLLLIVSVVIIFTNSAMSWETYSELSLLN